ncbi:MAG: RNA-binding S4 domain-containing protein [Clostridia bacterium]|nr:RNA-binding S4 domain-containing protein [Clostridia bacterium]
MRIDKFLKVSRILKRRTLAQQACDKGKVIVNGKEVKPAKQIKIGDEVELQFTGGAVKFRILNIKETVKKDEASTLYEILSEDEN